MPQIDNIFIDTSIFVKENFLEGKRLQTILKLFQEGHFQLVLSIITVKEVKANFRKRVKVAVDEHNRLINDKSNQIQVLRNDFRAKDILKKFPDYKTISTDFNKKLDEQLQDCNALVLEYPELSIRGVFEDYFNGSSPFNKTDKKHEFPDAFAIAHLEEWCKANATTCIVFSTDKDFLGRPSTLLKIVPDYAKFLEEYLTTIAFKRIALLSTLFEQNSKFIDKSICDWLNDELDDSTIYYEYTNWMDVHDISNVEIVIDQKNYQVISLDEEAIEVEITTNLSYAVELEIDDENTYYYDSDDKEVYYPETTAISLEKNNFLLKLTTKFFIIDEEDYHEECEIEEINEGKKLDLDFDKWPGQY